MGIGIITHSKRLGCFAESKKPRPAGNRAEGLGRDLAVVQRLHSGAPRAFDLFQHRTEAITTKDTAIAAVAFDQFSTMTVHPILAEMTTPTATNHPRSEFMPI